MKKMIKYNIDSDIRKKIYKYNIGLSLLIKYYFGPGINKLITYILKTLDSNLANFIIPELSLPTIFFLISWLVNNCIWKLPIINNIIGVPNLNGYWQGNYISSFKCENISGCKCINKDNCFFPIKGQERESCSHSAEPCNYYNQSGKEGLIDFEIKQTLEKISIYSRNEKSSSYNRTTSILIDDFVDPILIYEHFNEIDIIKSDKGMINHSGFNQLKYYTEHGNKILEGRYYNDQNRGTYGNVKYIKK